MLSHRFNRSVHNAVENLLNHVRSHRWHMNVYKSEMEGVNYYVCKKTGDRKAERNTLRPDCPDIDEAWLKKGSGRYYINGEEHGQATNTAEAVKKVRMVIASEKKRRDEEARLLFSGDVKKRFRRTRALTF